MKGGSWPQALLAGVLVCLAACTSSGDGLVETSPSPNPSPTPSPSPTAPLALGATPFHGGEIGLAYGPVSLSATGGQPPYAWSLDSGKLPPGLNISTDGTVSGQPTAAGGYMFKVKVADSAGASQLKQIGVTIYKALSVAPYCDVKCIIGAGCSKCGGVGAVSGGFPPYSYQVTGGAVPTGMGMSGLVLTGGFPKGSYSLTVQVTDQLGGQATANANWSIYSPAALKKGGDCIDFSYPPRCTARWTYSGGSPNTAPKLVILAYSQYCNPNAQCGTPAAPPQGWAVSVKSGVVTISVQTPNQCVTNYLGTLTLALVDPSACSTTSNSNAVNLAVDLQYAC
jgi:hypothetical protein